MDTFDLGRLTDFDFEAVCKDLFESILESRLEIFTPGTDRGIDLRYMSAGSSNVVIQCKNWERNKRSSLMSHMAKVELPKIHSLQPGRYILATSVALSVTAKDQLAETLSPYVLSPGDIYGLHEIEALLRERPEIVARHLRLWLSSAQVLQALLTDYHSPSVADYLRHRIFGTKDTLLNLMRDAGAELVPLRCSDRELRTAKPTPPLGANRPGRVNVQEIRQPWGELPFSSGATRGPTARNPH